MTPLAVLLAAALAAAPVALPPPAAAATRIVTPEQFGAVGDGVHDDTAAVQAAFDAGGTVILAGAYAHRAVVYAPAEGERITGSGALVATDQTASALWVTAADVTVDTLTLVGTATTRQSAYEVNGLTVTSSGFRSTDLRVRGVGGAGIFIARGASDFVLNAPRVAYTLADGIHMTQGANTGRVDDPVVVGSGDDGVAVVSILSDGLPCHDITVNRALVLGSHARGVSVVGGTDVTYNHPSVGSSAAAGVYVATEDGYRTAGVSHVRVVGGLVADANTDPATDHGAILVVSGTDQPISDVTVTGVVVVRTRETASRSLAVLTYGATPTGVAFTDIAVSGGPASTYQGNSPVTLTDITQDGVPVG